MLGHPCPEAAQEGPTEEGRSVALSPGLLCRPGVAFLSPHPEDSAQQTLRPWARRWLAFPHPTGCWAGSSVQK